MKEIPILFSTPMVLAILGGQKTQTRRVVKGSENFPDIVRFFPCFWEGERQFRNDVTPLWLSKEPDGTTREWGCPYGVEGDRLWVRETWRVALSKNHECYAYKADNSYQCGKQAPSDCNATWKPSIHMPKKACRLWLEVVNVRVERLRDISEEDAIAEGVICEDGLYWDYLNNEYQYKSAIASYESLWMSIHGAESFLKNVWVWVVEFRRLTK